MWFIKIYVEEYPKQNPIGKHAIGDMSFIFINYIIIIIPSCIKMGGINAITIRHFQILKLRHLMGAQDPILHP